MWTYFRKVDFLRAVAIVVVLLSHWIEDCNIEGLMFASDYGSYGVKLFFTISGFLITHSLLTLFSKHSFKESLKIFFLKRVLRLFPAFYLYIVIALLLQVVLGFWIVNDLNDFWYYAFYAGNFFIYFNGNLYPSLNHTWSLAVEEQFYLVWPFIVFAFRKYLPIVFILLALPVYYLVATNFDGSSLFPIGHLNYLVGGSLLTLFPNKINVRNSLIAASVFSLSLFFITNHAIFEIVLAAIFVLVLNMFIKEFKPPFERLFSNQFILYIGKISYGIYLYHRVLPHFINAFLNKYSIYVHKVIVFSSLFVIVFIISHLSYQYYEKFFLRLKDRMN